ncbi:MAG TPA: hypothetical protein VHU19_12345 [Pyrinomonadaceae bacterium]|nr:hypothetical protein [Pyrinomonadaceae bacterium]
MIDAGHALARAKASALADYRSDEASLKALSTAGPTTYTEKSEFLTLLSPAKSLRNSSRLTLLRACSSVSPRESGISFSSHLERGKS